jgi:ABC-2 type transport system ATP-binding protein
VGHERPTRGDVRVFGHDPRQNPGAVLKKVGYVPQAPNLYDELSVADHLEMAAWLRPGFDLTGSRSRVRDLGVALQAIGRDLSGGEKAQVALSIALSTRADMLLLDEPLAHLDPLARREFLRVASRAGSSEGRTVLLSSHIISDIEEACDRLIVLGVGRILWQGPIRDALAMHSIVPDGYRMPPSDGVIARVATFPGPAGTPLTCVRHAVNGDLPGMRAATLEEVVLAYLSASRGESDTKGRSQ